MTKEGTEEKAKQLGFLSTILGAIKSVEFISVLVTIVEIFAFQLLSVKNSAVESLSLFFLQYIALKSALRIDKTLNKIQNTNAKEATVKEIQQTGARQITLENYLMKKNFLTKRQDLEERLPQTLAEAMEIRCSGISLPALLGSGQLAFLKRKCRDGCKMRILLTDPAQVRHAIMADYIDRDSLTDLCYSMENILELRKTFTKSIEAKLMASFPGYGLQIIDPKKKPAKIKVELYTASIETNSRPNFFIDSETQNYWFNWFIDDFEKLWERSSELTEKKVADTRKLIKEL